MKRPQIQVTVMRDMTDAEIKHQTEKVYKNLKGVAWLPENRLPYGCDGFPFLASECFAYLGIPRPCILRGSKAAVRWHCDADAVAETFRRWLRRKRITCCSHNPMFDDEMESITAVQRRLNIRYPRQRYEYLWGKVCINGVIEIRTKDVQEKINKIVAKRLATEARDRKSAIREVKQMKRLVSRASKHLFKQLRASHENVRNA